MSPKQFTCIFLDKADSVRLQVYSIQQLNKTTSCNWCTFQFLSYIYYIKMHMHSYLNQT